LSVTVSASNHADPGRRVTVSAAIHADPGRRMLRGTLWRIGEVGHTSKGPLRILDPHAIELPADLTSVEMTREHEDDNVRGSLAMVDNNAERCYIAVRVADGPAGDAALAEASSRARAGFSYVISDAIISDGVIVKGRLDKIGQVSDPAYNSARIDQIAAAKAAQQNPQPEGATAMTLSDEQQARLDELRALDNLTPEQRAELAALEALEAAPDAPAEDAAPAAPAPAAPAAAAPVAAARVPAVPAGVPGRRPGPQAQSGAYDRFVQTVTRALSPGGGGLATISAAFTDVTNTANPAIEAPAWSGELWSGLQYEPEFSVLLNSGDLTSWEGSGWRWVTKPVMQDYAGDKTAVPSGALATEPSSYEAARMAVGHDLDRKFYDFPNEGFLRSYGEAAREDWAVKLDAKVEAWLIANAVTFGAATTSLLRAAALAVRGVKKNTKARATFVIVNEGDFFDLIDINEQAVPAFLEMFNVDPKAFVPSENVPAGEVVAGVKQAATVRTLPGSPIRVDAQHLANGGVDSAFFGYWAIEEHHTTGVVKTTFA
jgi:hypothetical protein